MAEQAPARVNTSFKLEPEGGIGPSISTLKLSKLMENNLRRQLIMLSKKIIYTFLFQLFFCAVLLANTGNAQRNSIEKVTVSLNLKEQSLVQFFKQVESKTDFKFTYSDNLVDLKQPVTVVEKNISLYDVLVAVSKQTQLNFVQVNDNIHVKKAGSSKNSVKIVELMEVTVSGKVTDDKGDPLPGASVTVAGTTTGTVTDIDGDYKLTVPDGSILVFSYVGFETMRVSVNDRSQLNVSLQPDMSSLEEVIVVGYGTVKKSDLTGAVSSVNQEELTAYPAVNAIQALQGRAAGVSVQSNNGEPGGNFKIRIRGGTSINASSDPLIVVDGLVGGVLPPPEDIASIEVLKDASATAIYGSRGANGVVMVTTKTGGIGKTQISFNTSYSFQEEIGRLDVLNARQFGEYINEARNTNFIDLDAINTDTDWQEMIFRPGAIQNHQLSMSGGTDRIKYYVSGVMFDQKGVIRNSDFQRYSLTTNLRFNVSEKIRLSLNSTLRNSNKEGVLSQSGGGATNSGVVTAAERFDPNQGIIGQDGLYSMSEVGIAAFENPMAVLDGREEEQKQDNMQINTKAEFDLAKGLVLNSTFGSIISTNRNGIYNSRISNLGQNTNGRASLDYSRNFNFLTEQYLNYDFSLQEKNKFMFTMGYSYQNFTRESFSAANSGFITDALGYWNLGVGTNLLPPSSEHTKSEIASLYSRVNYSFDERYLFTFTARYDGASQFSSENKWSFFPSGAFSWNISNENFYPQNAFITTAKLRSSYGITGNQGINPFQSLARLESTFFVVNDSRVNSVLPSSIANKDLTWETTAQFNVGLDLELVDNRISMTAEYYRKETNDLLFNVPIASFSGYQNRLENVGSIENKGFEFQLNSRNLVGDFVWSSGFNLTMNRNKVLALKDDLDIIYASAPSFIGTIQNSILRVGSPVGSFFGFVYEGVYQEGDEFIPGGTFESQPGGEKFADLNGDGRLDSNDRQIIGNPNPIAIWGLNNDFSYKGFSLNIFLQAVSGADMLNLVRMELDRLSGNSNATTAALRRWTPENTDTDIPKARAGRVPRTSTRFVEDGSFIRLKNISLGYNINPVLLDRLKLSSARIYISGQNLLTFTNYSGVDPEVAFSSSNVNLGLDYGSYPNTKSYTVGINIGF